MSLAEQNIRWPLHVINRPPGLGSSGLVLQSHLNGAGFHMRKSALLSASHHWYWVLSVLAER